MEALFLFFVELLCEDEVLLAEEFVVFFEEVDFVEEGEVFSVFDEHGDILLNYNGKNSEKTSEIILLVREGN